MASKHPNAGETQRRNAERKRCPECGRGAALVRLAEPGSRILGSRCRWVERGMCTYVEEGRSY